MSLFFSTSIILDLYFVLKNPFSSSEARVKKMTTASITSAFFLSAMCLTLTLTRDPDWCNLNNYLFVAIAIINILLGIIIMVFVVITFRTKGMSKEIKKSIQKRYLEFITVYILLEGPFIFYSKPMLYYDSETHVYSGETIYISHWYLCIVTLFGFFVGISRMRDRIVFTKIKNICYSFTCRRHKRVGYVEFDKIVEKSQMNTFWS